MTQPHVSVISGSDSFGVAGMQIDLQALAHLGVRCSTALTCITAQNSEQWLGLESASTRILEKQLDALGKARPDAIKIGMVPKSSMISVISDFLDSQEAPVVLDPVMGASIGPTIWDDQFTKLFNSLLLPRITLLTPNLPEFNILTGRVTDTSLEIAQAASPLFEKGVQAILVKGGHREGPQVADIFLTRDFATVLSYPRLAGEFRGTGCALSSLIAGNLARRESLVDAIVLSKRALQEQMTHAVIKGSAHLTPWQPDQKLSELPTATPLGKPSPQQFLPMDGGSIGIYPIVDRVEKMLPLIEAGITTIQLRIKDLEGEALASQIAQATSLCRKRRVRLFINDYWKLAIEYQSYGVHLGQEDLEDAPLESIQKAGLRLGVSTHCVSEAAVAHGVKPSYIALGPIFETTCKSMRFGPRGIAMTNEWVQMFPEIPIVAIGGLKPQHISSLQDHGADGVAVISDIVYHENPRKRAEHWITIWNGNRLGQDSSLQIARESNAPAHQTSL